MYASLNKCYLFNCRKCGTVDTSSCHPVAWDNCDTIWMVTTSIAVFMIFTNTFMPLLNVAHDVEENIGTFVFHRWFLCPSIYLVKSYQLGWRLQSLQQHCRQRWATVCAQIVILFLFPQLLIQHCHSLEFTATTTSTRSVRCNFFFPQPELPHGKIRSTFGVYGIDGEDGAVASIAIFWPESYKALVTTGHLAGDRRVI